MKLRTLFAASALTITAGTLVAAPPAQAAVPQGAVSIKVQLGGVLYVESTYRTFEVKNVVPGPGPELTVSNETSNYFDYCGDLSVDINPANYTVTIGNAEEVCDFSAARVTITSRHLGNATVVSDDLFGSHAADFPRTVTNKISGATNTTVFDWRNKDDNWEEPTGTAVAKFAKLTYTGGTRPVIGGTPKAGKTLRATSANAASFTPDAAKRTFQWFRSGKAIKGATKAVYKVRKADRRKRITVKVTATGYAVTSKTVTSKAVRIKK